MKEKENYSLNYSLKLMNFSLNSMNYSLTIWTYLDIKHNVGIVNCRIDKRNIRINHHVFTTTL